MSISSPQSGGQRRPSVNKAVAGAGAKPGSAAKPRAATPARADSGTKVPAARQQGVGDGRGPGQSGRRAGSTPTAQATAERHRPWASVALFTAVFLLAAAIIGFGAYKVHENGLGWQARADRISGIVDYRAKSPKILTRNHKYGAITYTISPPVGGDHNPNWQRCQGDVYTSAIPNENAVDSLEHGAVWITYRPELPQAQVATLESKVRGNEYMLMSPYPNLDSPISLQAWGFQLKVKNADDSRIDDFIKDLKQKASMESDTSCATGTYVTGTGSTPFDLGSPPATPSASPSASTGASASPAASASAAPSA